MGAAVAVSVGAGSIGVVGATIESGDRPVLVQIAPCRLLDTRETAPIGAGETLTVPAHGMNGDCTIPAEASGLSLNVTAVQASEQTNVRIFPDANAVPNASNLNPSPGSPPVPNAVTTQLDAAGAFSIFNEFGTVGLVVDVNGYYEDHNHDDRYVQQADLLWAVVEVDGDIDRSTEGVVSSERVEEGRFAVLFDRDISGCVYQATAGRPVASIAPQIGFAMVTNTQDEPLQGVTVWVKDQGGFPADRAFHLTVHC